MRDVVMRAAERAGSTFEDLGDGLYRLAEQMLVLIDETSRVCAVYSIMRELVGEAHRPDVAQFLIERNYYLRVGAFEMDLDDGEVRLRTSIDALHASFDEAVVTNLVAANLSLFAVHHDAISGLAAGTLTLAQARAQFTA
jgi:hypothetical protein